MTQTTRPLGKTVGAGIAAGLAGTGAMMAMRSFDEQYAPRTIPDMKEDPGQFIVNAAEQAAPTWAALPKPLAKGAAFATHLGYGTLFGVIYALVRGRRQRHSALVDGVFLGLGVYAAGYLGWLPALGLGRPAWKQEFPQVAGEALRHVAYGVSTAAALNLIRSVAANPSRKQ